MPHKNLWKPDSLSPHFLQSLYSANLTRGILIIVMLHIFLYFHFFQFPTSFTGLFTFFLLRPLLCVGKTPALCQTCNGCSLHLYEHILITQNFNVLAKFINHFMCIMYHVHDSGVALALFPSKDQPVVPITIYLLGPPFPPPALICHYHL